eukprot:g4476.t1
MRFEIWLFIVVMRFVLISFAQPNEGSSSEGYFTIQQEQIHCKVYKPSGEGTYVNVSAVQVILFYNSAKATVLLLHGGAFSSENWKEIGTLESLQSGGILAFAIDLPGFGKSKDAKVSDRASFLKEVVDYLDGEVKVIVSPSMSGSFSIPYINIHGDEIDGYVPVAPVSVNLLSPSKKVSRKLSVLAVSGERDSSGIANLPKFNETFASYDQLIIPNAGHPAYLDNPELFNSRLKEFTLSLTPK